MARWRSQAHTRLKRPSFERPAPAEGLRAGGLADRVEPAAGCLRRHPSLFASAGLPQCNNATLKDVGRYSCGKARRPVYRGPMSVLAAFSQRGGCLPPCKFELRLHLPSIITSFDLLASTMRTSSRLLVFVLLISTTSGLLVNFKPTLVARRAPTVRMKLREDERIADVSLAREDEQTAQASHALTRRGAIGALSAWAASAAAGTAAALADEAVPTAEERIAKSKELAERLAQSQARAAEAELRAQQKEADLQRQLAELAKTTAGGAPPTVAVVPPPITDAPPTAVAAPTPETLTPAPPAAMIPSDTSSDVSKLASYMSARYGSSLRPVAGGLGVVAVGALGAVGAKAWARAFWNPSAKDPPYQAPQSAQVSDA